MALCPGRKGEPMVKFLREFAGQNPMTVIVIGLVGIVAILQWITPNVGIVR